MYTTFKYYDCGVTLSTLSSLSNLDLIMEIILRLVYGALYSKIKISQSEYKLTGPKMDIN